MTKYEKFDIDEKALRRSLLLIYVNAGLTPVEYAVILPTIWLFLQQLNGSTLILGIAVSSFNFAKTLFFPVTGWLADRYGFKKIFMLSLFLGAFGSVLYGFADVVGHWWLVVAGRTITGISASNATLTLSYITRISEDEKTRTK